MDEIIQIKCPFDGAVLSVRNQQGIETKNVTCPICKKKFPFTQFRRVYSTQTGDDPDTEYPEGRRNNGGSVEEPTSTELPKMNFTLGKLNVVGTGVSFQLKPGRNVIGRKASTSQADFQIDTAGSKFMSREHLLVEVKNLPSMGFVHYVSLLKEKLNATFIGNDQLIYGDCIVLNHGDTVKLPDAVLKFEIPDEEGTEI